MDDEQSICIVIRYKILDTIHYHLVPLISVTEWNNVQAKLYKKTPLLSLHCKDVNSIYCLAYDIPVTIGLWPTHTIENQLNQDLNSHRCRTWNTVKKHRKKFY